MTSLSILSPSASLVLRSLADIRAEIEEHAGIVASGSRISPTRNPAAYVLAQSLKSNLGLYESLQSGFASARATVSAASAGVTQITSIFNELKSLAEQAAGNISNSERSTLSDEFNALKDQLTSLVSGASYNGKNLIASGSTSLQFTSDINGGTRTIAATPDVGNLIASFLSDIDRSGNSNDGIKSESGAEDTFELFDDDDILERLSTALGSLTSGTKSIDFADQFNTSLIDITSEHLSSLVEVDLGKESAILQALAVHEQLAMQVLNIVNQRPQTLLSLFQFGG